MEHMSDFYILSYKRPIILWLCLCAALVAAMVMLGGYTRLSGSGLSITEWKPIHGAIPPLNETEWMEEFDAYRASPQYAQINSGMSLSEFKAIFWPEFLHRQLGRILGLVFFIPFLFFAAKKSFSRKFAWRLAAIFALGGLQGLIGWLMVKSGVMEGPYVSHVRLALHLSMAFAIYGLIVWTVQDVIASATKQSRLDRHVADAPRDDVFKIYLFWFTLLCLQIILGALVAGLHAGLLYPTYPLMGGQLIPSDLLAESPWWHNRVLLQFTHRHLAFFVTAGFVIWWYLWRAYVKNNRLGKVCGWVAAVIAFQFALGVATLMHMVPLPLALAHQMTALVLFTLAVVLLHKLKGNV